MPKTKSPREIFTTLRAKIVEHVAYKKDNSKMPQNLFWYSQYSGYPKGLLEYNEYLARIDELGNSGDRRMINAAIEAMQRILGLYSEK